MDHVLDWMTYPVITVDPGMSVDDARQLMWSNNIRHLPVMDRKRLVGIVSERDVHCVDHPAAALAGAQRVFPGDSRRSLRAVMMTAVQTVWPDDTMVYAASVMAQWKIGALPVVDGDRLIGIITTTDCLRALVTLHRSTSAQPISAH